MKVSAIAFEGSVIIIYTTEYDKFSGNDEIPRNLAQSLRRRVDIRPDPSTLENAEKVREKILSMIPESAEVFDINFIFNNGDFRTSFITILISYFLKLTYKNFIKQFLISKKR